MGHKFPGRKQIAIFEAVLATAFTGKRSTFVGLLTIIGREAISPVNILLYFSLVVAHPVIPADIKIKSILYFIIQSRTLRMNDAATPCTFRCGCSAFNSLR